MCYEMGMYKHKIHTALYNNKNIVETLLGDISEMTPQEIIKDFKKHVESHLFVAETITDAGTFIFYDIEIPIIRTNIKQCNIILYIICHRKMLDDGFSIDGYIGNRADIMSQLVEETLLDKEVLNDFGIGALNLVSNQIYNSSRFYGRIMTFEIPNFR